MILTFHYVSVLTCTKLHVKEKKILSPCNPCSFHLIWCANLYSCQVWEGGPLFTFDGNFVGMTLFLVIVRAHFISWGSILDWLKCTSLQKKTKVARYVLIMYYYYQCLLFIDSPILSFYHFPPLPVHELAFQTTYVCHNLDRQLFKHCSDRFLVIVDVLLQVWIQTHM